MKYVYPAVFTKEPHDKYSVDFSDLESCYACGDSLEDALLMAEDVLAYTLYHYERTEQQLPNPSDRASISTGKDEFINYVACDTIEYKKKNNTRAVKKTLSIPEWLNEEATAKGINFSAVLQDALKRTLGL